MLAEICYCEILSVASKYNVQCMDVSVGHVKFDIQKSFADTVTLLFRLYVFLFGTQCIFTTRRSYDSVVLGVVILSVPLSVRLCVCLSHACFVAKPNNALRIF